MDKDAMRFIIFAALIFMTLGKLALSAEPLVLVTPVNTVDTVISEVIVREAYRRIGTDIVIKKYPAERALHLANQGEVAGEIQRIDGIAANYPNLIQVYPPINYIEGVVFSKSVAFEIDGWESLRPYRIGIIRGIKFAERNTVGMNVLQASVYSALFKMLDRKRFDIIVSPRRKPFRPSTPCTRPYSPMLDQENLRRHGLIWKALVGPPVRYYPNGVFQTGKGAISSPHVKPPDYAS